MSNEELILEIIEKVHEQSRETASRVNDLQIEQVRQGEIHRVNSKNLEEHMRRTEAVEKRVAFYDSVAIVVAGLGTIALFILKILPAISGLLR